MKINWLFKFIVLLSGMAVSSAGQAAITDTLVQDALKALYTSTGGSSWTTNTGWTSDTSIDILCPVKDIVPPTTHGIICDGSSNVVELVLNDNNLVGTIPSQIGDLTNLVRLKLHNNILNGNIPSELGLLSKLVELRLFNNELEGSIPESLTDLTNLLYLELYDNRLSGQLPVGLGKLTGLWNFYIHGNQFIGNIPVDLLDMGSANANPLTLNLNLGWNAVISQDATLNSFINTNHVSLYEDSQTLAPTGFVLDAKTSTSVTLRWDSFQTNPATPGGYKVLMATSEVGPFTQVIPDIYDRFSTNAQINNLSAGINYWFKLCNYTDVHSENSNIVISEDSVVVSKGVPVVGAGVDQVVDELTPVTLNASANDTDGGSIVSYSWSLGGVVIAGASSSLYSFTAPEVSASGTVLVFRVTVTDNDGELAYDDVQVTVNDTNPTVSAGADQTVDEGVSVQLEASASPGNPNGSIVDYSWEQVSGSPVTINNQATSIASFSFSIDDAAILSETLEFKVTVTDSDGKTATDNVQITVNNVLTPPSVDLGADQTVNEGATVTLSASVSDNGTVVEYSWSQVSGLPVDWVVSPTNPSILSFSAPQQPAESSEVFLFEVMVTDNDGMTATDQVQVTVNDVAPEVDITTDQPGIEIEEGTLIELIALANDRNEDFKYYWEQLIQNNEDLITLENIDTPRTRFKAPGTKGNRSIRLYFKVTVTSVDGQTASADVYVIVTKKNVVVTGGGGALGWPWLLLMGMPLLGRRFLK